MALGTLALALIALFIPPLPVLLKRGCSGQFLLNLILLLLFWIPAVLHAWWILAEDRDRRKVVHHRRVRSGSRGSRGENVHLGAPPPPPAQGYYYPPPPPAQAYGAGYGTGVARKY